MNSSNQKNTTSGNTPGFYLTEDQWLTITGSTWSLDIFLSYRYMLTSIIGLVSNAYSLAVFQDADFNTDLYKYLRIYCVSNMAVALFATGNCFYNDKRVFPWSNSYSTQAYAAFFYFPMASVLNFYGCMIDIFILIDRIGRFNPRIKALVNWPVYKTCAVTFVAVFVFCLPLFAAYSSNKLTVMLNETTPFTIWYAGASPYFNVKLIGAIWLAVLLLVKDGLVMIVQLALNVASIILLKQFWRKKIRFITNNRVTAAARTVTMREVNNTNAAGNRASFAGSNLSSTISSRRVNISVADQKATVSNLIVNIH
jgi:hypothetical protein